MEAQEIRKFTLTKPQAEIFLNPKRYKIVNAGRRFGKTWLAGAFIMNKCINFDHKTVIYIAPTSDMAFDLMWDTWIREHIPEEYVASKNEQKMLMRFKNGSRFMCLSADKPDRLVGKKADLMIVDECALINESKEAFYDKLQPLLADKYVDGEALYISTPRGYNWFYDIYKEGEHDLDTACFQFTTIEGGNLTQEEIIKQKAKLSPKMFAQEYLASFETMSNRIYENYDRNLNACELDVSWGLGDIHVGMDFNVNPMTAAISVIERGSIYFFDEIVEPGSNTEEVAKLIRKKYPEATVYVYPDPTGHRGQTNAPVGQTDFSILRKNGFIVCAPGHAYPSKDKWNSVNAALLNAEGKRRVFVAKNRCAHLKKAWEGFTFKENGDPDKSSGLDHISDAAAYLICYRLPFNGGQKVSRPKVLGV